MNLYLIQEKGRGSLASHLPTSSGTRTLSLRRTHRATRSCGRSHWYRLCLSLALDWLRRRSRRVPVVDHLQSQDSIQSSTSNESVQDQLIVHLLQSCENSRERADEVVEDLDPEH